MSAKPFTTYTDFFFRTPLYTVCDFGKSPALGSALLFHPIPADGWCPQCRKESTFRASGTRGAGTPVFETIPETTHHVRLHCARVGKHELDFYISKQALTLQRIGQTPSFADIAQDESKTYARILSREAASELHKAIGLAAHGAAIGAFVYLRRIFESLINERFHYDWRLETIAGVWLDVRE
jgi:hypothetical protein